LHPGTGRLDMLAEQCRAIRLGQDRIGNVTPNLPRIDIPRRHNSDVAWRIAAEFAVHKTDRVVRSGAVMLDPLYERARAIADAGDGDVDSMTIWRKHQAALRSAARRSSRLK
jgi:hypothetical protein